MRLSTKQVGKQLAGLVLAVLLLIWVFRDTRPEQLWQQVQQASLAGLLLAMAIGFTQTFFRVWRWGSLLAPVRAAVPFNSMFRAVVLGYATTVVVPGRLGELVRPALLSGREGIPLGPTVGSVISDRILDLGAVVLFFGLGLLTTPLRPEVLEHATLIKSSALGLLLLVGLPFLALLALSVFRKRLEPWLARRGRALGWLGQLLLSLSIGTDAFRRPRLLLPIAANTLLIWGAITSGTWLALRACGIAITPGESLILLPLLVVGVALPTPGGAGGYHAAMTFGLVQIFGIDRSAAAAASILVHFSAILPFIFAGLAILVTDRTPFQEILEAARQVKTPPRVDRPKPDSTGRADRIG